MISGEICDDETIKSPIDILQPLIYKPFNVELSMNTLQTVQMRKQARNLIKIENQFGRVKLNGIDFMMTESYFHVPSEHKINGQRLPMEFQMIGKNAVGGKVGLSVMFTIGDQVNYFLNELSFGKGYLKELPISTQMYSKFYKVTPNISFGALFTNNNSWIMYDGSDTNVPCDDITWLVSYDVVSVHPEQLYDFPTDSVPFFSSKPLNSRTIYRNQHNEEERLAQIQMQEQQQNSQLQAKNSMDIKREEDRQKQVLADAIEGVQEAKNVEAKEAEAKIQAEKKKQRDIAVAKIAAERKKLEQVKIDEKAKQAQADAVYPTTMLYERIMDRIRDFAVKPPPCPEYAIYEPPAGKPWGFVPNGRIMTWEIYNYQHTPNLTIATPPLPSPQEIKLVYKPFYYTYKPACQSPPDPHRPLLPPISQQGTLKSLAKIDLNIMDTPPETNKTLIPVLVKTTPDFKVPTVPSTQYVMLNATSIPKEATPSPTNPNIYSYQNGSVNTSIGVAPVPIQRDFQPDFYAQQKLDQARQQNIATKPSSTGGYDMPPPIPEAERPNYFNVTPPEKGKVVNVWPPLKPEWEEGTLPIDVKYAWNPILESETIVGLSPPASPDKEFRWILFFWMEAKYGLGENKKPPWIPVYILARSDFKWDRDQVPADIPVIKNFTYGKDGRLPIKNLALNFEPRKVEDMIQDGKLLDPPVGVDPVEAFPKPTEFRIKLDKILNVQNPLYIKALEDKYRTLPGLLSDLQVQRYEEETGIIIDKDIYWRVTQQELELKRIEEERKKDLAASAPKTKRVTRYERVCLEYNLEVVLNHRFNFDLDHVHPKNFKYCSKWGWKEYTEDIPLNNTQPTNNGSNTTKPGSGPGSNSPNGTSGNGNNETDPKAGPGANLDDQSKKEQRCKEYLQIILNNRKLFFADARKNDYMDKECEEIFGRMREERLRNFKGGLGPMLKIIADTSAKSAQMLKNSAEEAKKLGEEFAQKHNLDKLKKPKFDTSSVPVIDDPSKLTTQKLLAQQVEDD